MYINTVTTVIQKHPYIYPYIPRILISIYWFVLEYLSEVILSKEIPVDIGRLGLKTNWSKQSPTQTQGGAPWADISMARLLGGIADQLPELCNSKNSTQHL